MLKGLLRISEYSKQSAPLESPFLTGSAVSRQQSKNIRKFLLVFLLFTVYCSLLTVSCAPKHVEMPLYRGVDLDTALSELKGISSIEAILSINYENDDIIMSGDALLTISENMLNLKLYHLGFLSGEITEDNGFIKSNPPLDRNKSILLVEGMRHSFLWWNIDGYIMQEKEDLYIISNYGRKILINKKTLLPVKQIIELKGGEKLNIFYDSPKKIDYCPQNGGIGDNIELQASFQPLCPELNTDSPFAASYSLAPLWYQSQLKIELKGHVVKIKVKSYSAVR